MESFDGKRCHGLVSPKRASSLQSLNCTNASVSPLTLTKVKLILVMSNLDCLIILKLRSAFVYHEVLTFRQGLARKRKPPETSQRPKVTPKSDSDII